VKEEKLAGYVETSAIRGGPDVDRVFHQAVRVVLDPPAGEKSEGAVVAKMKRELASIFECFRL